MMSQVWIYELPEQLDDRATPNPQAAIQAQLIRSLRASPYLASEPGAASFYLVPLPFDGNPGFQGREDSGAVLDYVRHTWPWFNASLRHSEPWLGLGFLTLTRTLTLTLRALEP